MERAQRGNAPQTAFEAMHAGFEEYEGVLTGEGCLTDDPFGDGEAGDSWDGDWDYSYEAYFEAQDKAAEELAMVEQLAMEALEQRDWSRPYTKAVIPQRLRWEVWKRDNYRCVHCEAWADLTIDHIIPEVHGGPTIIENLQTLCRSCNCKKGVK